jgi:hypothetical protein
MLKNSLIGIIVAALVFAVGMYIFGTKKSTNKASQVTYEAFVVHIDRNGYLKGDLSLLIVKGKDTTVYSPYIDTLFKKDSLGRDTKIPLLDSTHQIKMARVYYPTPDSAIKDIGSRLKLIQGLNSNDKTK